MLTGAVSTEQPHGQLPGFTAASQYKSLGDILTEALEAQQPDTEGAYLRGYHEGYDYANKIYCAYYQCNVCQAPLALEHDTAKRAVARYLREHGWGHRACHNRTS